MLYDPIRYRYEGLSSSALKVLATINKIQQEGKPVTIRGIGRRLGWGKSTHYLCYDVLPRLEAHGLIEKEGCKGGTIRSLCSIVVLEECLNGEIKLAPELS